MYNKSISNYIIHATKNLYRQPQSSKQATQYIIYCWSSIMSLLLSQIKIAVNKLPFHKRVLNQRCIQYKTNPKCQNTNILVSCCNYKNKIRLKRFVFVSPFSNIYSANKNQISQVQKTNVNYNHLILFQKKILYSFYSFQQKCDIIPKNQNNFFDLQTSQIGKFIIAKRKIIDKKKQFSTVRAQEIKSTKERDVCHSVNQQNNMAFFVVVSSYLRTSFILENLQPVRS
eukprot:TRINITY_DN18252_c0_g1_i1.p1 TRINITY_DN18252_c0_g1~~TRINITY_DN18252_c0_g1_i1.p1  ORF type:complete len:251 (-),score=-7.39 TRINITY_DN18252_c0_g1_i1:432-1115(-)